MSKELETSFDEDIPVLTSLADADQALAYDASASAGSKIVRITWLNIYNYIKAKIDAAYGAFVTRWPTFDEVTNKPIVYNQGVKRTVSPAGGGVTINLEAGNYNVIQLSANETVNSGTVDESIGAIFAIEFIQDATGSRTITWSGDFECDTVVYASGISDVQPDGTANARTVMFFMNTGTKYLLLGRPSNRVA